MRAVKWLKHTVCHVPALSGTSASGNASRAKSPPMNVQAALYAICQLKSDGSPSNTIAVKYPMAEAPHGTAAACAAAAAACASLPHSPLCCRMCASWHAREQYLMGEASSRQQTPSGQHGHAALACKQHQIVQSSTISDDNVPSWCA